MRRDAGRPVRGMRLRTKQAQRGAQAGVDAKRFTFMGRPSFLDALYWLGFSGLNFFAFMFKRSV